jgi:hypothetical protein
LSHGLGRSPFCGVGHGSALDHNLPKTKFPQLLVVPLNLVPSCKNCNTGNNTVIAVSGDLKTSRNGDLKM